MERPDQTWAPRVPLTVGERFSLDAEVELGAHGVTYAGTEPATGRPVNVLVFHPAFFVGERGAANAERLERARVCEHPGLAPVLEVGAVGSTRWIATPPVGGLPLTHWRRDRGEHLPLTETYRVMAQLLDALEAVHAIGGVHGSLSPETVRFHPGLAGDRVVVAQPWWFDGADVPQDELKPLRTAWLAPELLFGEPSVDPATDVYGLGLVLGYCLARGLTEPGHSLLVQGIDVPPGLDDVYVIATSRQTEHRFPDIASLREALAAAGQSEWDDAEVAARRMAQHPAAEAGPGGGALKVEVLEVEDADLDASALLEAMGAPPPNIENTSEDIALPAELTGWAGGRSFADASADENERTDTAMPAFLLDEDEASDGAGGPSSPAHEPALSGAMTPLGPVTGRSQRRVVAQTLPHGQQRPADDQAQLDSALGSGLHPVPAPLAPQDEPALGKALASMEVDLGAPPPPAVPAGQTILRLGARPGSSSPAQQATPAAPSRSAARPPLPAASKPEAPATPPALPPALPTSITAKAVPASAFSSSLEVLDALPAGPPTPPPLPLPPHARPPAPASLHEPLVGESTVVEAIAPALLDIEVLGPPPPPVAAPDPFSEPDAVFDPESLLAAPGAKAPRPQAQGASDGLLPEDADATLTAIIAGRIPSRETQRPARTESLPSGPLKPMVAHAATDSTGQPQAPLAIDEPRFDRPTSGVLSGAQLVTGAPAASGLHAPVIHGGPSSMGAAPVTLGAAYGTPLHGGDPTRLVAEPKSSRWILWAALAALVIGGIIAFLAFGSSGPGEPQTAGMNGAGQSDPGQGDPKDPGTSTGRGGPTAVPVTALVDGPETRDPSEPDTLVAGPAEPPDKGDDARDESELDASADEAGPELTLAATGDDASPVDAGGPDPMGDLVEPAEVLALAMAEVVEADTAAGPTPAPDQADAQVAGAAGTGPDAAVAPGTDTAVAAGPADPADATTAADAVGEADPVKMPEIVTDPDKLRCPDGMARLRRKIEVEGPNATKLESWEVVCIDRFEYPGGGAMPSVGLDLAGARAACASRGKRLCTRSEWRRACGGTYPYGREYDPERCNTAGADGAPKPLVATGSKRGCMSPSGAFDMVGNAAEWTSDGFINGGTSLRNSDDATCSSGSKRVGGAPHIGFRCCVDAK